MRGQKLTAPMSASKSLKKGNARANPVATTTYMVLQTSLNKLMLKFKFLLPIFMGYSLFTNSDLGHFLLHKDSTLQNTGCAITCTELINIPELVISPLNPDGFRNVVLNFNQPDLICSHKVQHNEDVGQVNQPEGLVKSKANQHVARCTVSECSIAETTAHHVEYGGGSH